MNTGNEKNPPLSSDGWAGTMASHLGRVVLTALCIFAASSGERVVADDDTAGPTVPSVGTVSELGSVADVGHPVARLTTFSEALRDGTDLAGKLAGVKGEAGLASKELGSDEELVSPEFRAFMKRHNKRQKYCPGSTSDAPCAELLRRCAPSITTSTAVPTKPNTPGWAADFFLAGK